MKKYATKIIADLYEMRVSTFNRYMEKSEKVVDASKYNFFNVIIANLCDRYGVTHDDIKEEMRDRPINEILDNNRNMYERIKPTLDWNIMRDNSNDPY